MISNTNKAMSHLAITTRPYRAQKGKILRISGISVIKIMTFQFTPMRFYTESLFENKNNCFSKTYILKAVLVDRFNKIKGEEKRTIV